MPLVSVIMPSYNHEKYISESIESVLGQTLGDLELIIVDDGSKDKSIQIIEDFVKKDNRVRAYFHEKNMGIARTVNDCIERATGKFIAFTASDDVWVKEKLEKQLKVLEQNEDIVVWSEGEIIDAQGNPTGKLFTHRFGAANRKKSGKILEELLKGNYVCGQSRILKRENIEKIRFDETLRYLNDYKFELDLASRFEYFFIQEPLARYRIHGTNSMLSDRAGWQNDSIIVGQHILKNYGVNISNKSKCDCLLRISGGYSYSGNKLEAIRYLFRSIKINPSYTRNYIFLAVVLTSEDGYARNVLRKLNGFNIKRRGNNENRSC